jgi:hypothetical protein
MWPQNGRFSSVRRGGDLGAIRADRLTRGSIRPPEPPVAGSQPLPDMSHFAAEFLQKLRRSGLRASYVR